MADDTEHWVEVQKKTFTNWVNSFLSQRNQQIGDLRTELSDGLKLANLLEILSGETLPKRIDKNKLFKLHMVNNLNISLKFISDKNIRLVGCGAEDIVDGKLKLVLGLIWTLICFFQINQGSKGGGESAKQKLLDWVKSEFCGKFSELDSVNDFDESWRDGIAFCALVHSLKPGAIPHFSDLTKSNTQGNLELAFSKAETHLGIPRLLDPTDFAGKEKIDPLSVMTYVSFFSNASQSCHQSSLSDQDKAAAVLLFNAVDDDKSGNIDSGEFHQLMNKSLETPLSKVKTDSLFRQIDENDSGCITIDEFMEACEQQKEQWNLPEMLERIKKEDVRKSEEGEKENEDFKQKLIDLQKELREAATGRDAKAVELKEAVTKLGESNRQREKEKGASNLEVNDLRKQLEEALGRLGRKESEVEEALARLAESQKELVEREKQLKGELEDELQGMEKQREIWQKQLELERQKFKDALDQREIQSNADQTREKLEQTAQLQTQLEAEKAKLEGLEASLKKASEDLIYEKSKSRERDSLIEEVDHLFTPLHGRLVSSLQPPLEHIPTAHFGDRTHGQCQVGTWLWKLWGKKSRREVASDLLMAHCVDYARLLQAGEQLLAASHFPGSGGGKHWYNRPEEVRKRIADIESLWLELVNIAREIDEEDLKDLESEIKSSEEEFKRNQQRLAAKERYYSDHWASLCEFEAWLLEKEKLFLASFTSLSKVVAVGDSTHQPKINSLAQIALAHHNVSIFEAEVLVKETELDKLKSGSDEGSGEAVDDAFELDKLACQMKISDMTKKWGQIQCLFESIKSMGLEGKLNDATEELQEGLRREISELKEKLALEENQGREWKKKAEESIARLEEEKKTLIDDLGTKSLKLVESESAIQEIKVNSTKGLESIEDEKDRLKAMLREKTQLAIELEKEQESNQGMLREQREVIKDLKDQIQTSEEVVRLLNSKKERFEEDMERLSKRLKEKDELIKDLESDLNKRDQGYRVMESKGSELLTAQEKLEEELDITRGSLMKSRTLSEDLQSELEQVKKENSRLNSQMITLSSTSKSEQEKALQEQLDKKEQELVRSQKQLTDSQTAFGEQLKELDSARRQLKELVNKPATLSCGHDPHCCLCQPELCESKPVKKPPVARRKPTRQTPLSRRPQEPPDPVHEMVLKMFKDVTLPHPLKKLSPGVYQMGERRVNMRILSGQLMMKVGGGFMSFEEWVAQMNKRGIKTESKPSGARGMSVMSSRGMKTNKFR